MSDLLDLDRVGHLVGEFDLFVARDDDHDATVVVQLDCDEDRAGRFNVDLGLSLVRI